MFDAIVAFPHLLALLVNSSAKQWRARTTQLDRLRMAGVLFVVAMTFFMFVVGTTLIGTALFLVPLFISAWNLLDWAHDTVSGQERIENMSRDRDDDDGQEKARSWYN
jgi:hypothetical protein